MGLFDDVLGKQGSQPPTGGLFDDVLNPPSFAEKAKATARAFTGGVSEGFGPQMKSQFAAALEGGRPLDAKDWKDQWQNEADAEAQANLANPDMQTPTLLGVPESQMHNEIAQNLPQMAGKIGRAHV